MANDTFTEITKALKEKRINAIRDQLTWLIPQVISMLLVSKLISQFLEESGMFYYFYQTIQAHFVAISTVSNPYFTSIEERCSQVMNRTEHHCLDTIVNQDTRNQFFPDTKKTPEEVLKGCSLLRDLMVRTLREISSNEALETEIQNSLAITPSNQPEKIIAYKQVMRLYKIIEVVCKKATPRAIDSHVTNTIIEQIDWLSFFFLFLVDTTMQLFINNTPQLFCSKAWLEERRILPSHPSTKLQILKRLQHFMWSVFIVSYAIQIHHSISSGELDQYRKLNTKHHISQGKLYYLLLSFTFSVSSLLYSFIQDKYHDRYASHYSKKFSEDLSKLLQSLFPNTRATNEINDLGDIPLQERVINITTSNPKKLYDALEYTCKLCNKRYLLVSSRDSKRAMKILHPGWQAANEFLEVLSKFIDLENEKKIKAIEVAPGQSGNWSWSWRRPSPVRKLRQKPPKPEHKIKRQADPKDSIEQASSSTSEDPITWAVTIGDKTMKYRYNPVDITNGFSSELPADIFPVYKMTNPNNEKSALYVALDPRFSTINDPQLQKTIMGILTRGKTLSPKQRGAGVKILGKGQIELKLSNVERRNSRFLGFDAGHDLFIVKSQIENHNSVHRHIRGNSTTGSTRAAREQLTPTRKPSPPPGQ